MPTVLYASRPVGVFELMPATVATLVIIALMLMMTAALLQMAARKLNDKHRADGFLKTFEATSVRNLRISAWILDLGSVSVMLVPLVTWVTGVDADWTGPYVAVGIFSLCILTLIIAIPVACGESRRSSN